MELWLYSDLRDAHFDEKGSNLICDTSINLNKKNENLFLIEKYRIN